MMPKRLTQQSVLLTIYNTGVVDEQFQLFL